MSKSSTKTQPKDWLSNLVEKHAWGILTAIIAVSIWGATLMGRVEAVEDDVKDLKELITQVVVLQEQYKNTAISITEIKADIKDIKAAVK